MNCTTKKIKIPMPVVFKEKLKQRQAKQKYSRIILLKKRKRGKINVYNTKRVTYRENEKSKRVKI
jgi:hypothetical protein